jgi:hypothetical protein
VPLNSNTVQNSKSTRPAAPVSLRREFPNSKGEGELLIFKTPARCRRGQSYAYCIMSLVKRNFFVFDDLWGRGVAALGSS